jgi:hypothetical protein
MPDLRRLGDDDAVLLRLLIALEFRRCAIEMSDGDISAAL